MEQNNAVVILTVDQLEGVIEEAVVKAIKRTKDESMWMHKEDIMKEGRYKSVKHVEKLLRVHADKLPQHYMFGQKVVKREDFNRFVESRNEK